MLYAHTTLDDDIPDEFGDPLEAERERERLEKEKEKKREEERRRREAEEQEIISMRKQTPRGKVKDEVLKKNLVKKSNESKKSSTQNGGETTKKRSKSSFAFTKKHETQDKLSNSHTGVKARPDPEPDTRRNTITLARPISPDSLSVTIVEPNTTSRRRIKEETDSDGSEDGKSPVSARDKPFQAEVFVSFFIIEMCAPFL